MDIDTRADRCLDHGSIIDEVIRHFLFWNKTFRVFLKLHPRKAIVPCRAIRNKAVPATRAPPFGNAAALQHDVIDPGAAQMFAHRDTRLPTAYDHRICRLDHCSSPLQHRLGPNHQPKA